MRGTKYLSELMKDVKLSADKNNLIVAPIGSGKSTYLLKELSKGLRVIYLVDNSNLKEQILKEENTRSTSLNSIKRGFDFTDILVMTYKEFGYKILHDINDEFSQSYELIIADEIHSLIEYSEYKSDRELNSVIDFLMDKHKTPIVMCTATEYYLKVLCDNYPQLNENFNTIDFMNNTEILRYINKVTLTINNINQIHYYLKQSMEGFKFGGMKCGIYSKHISDMIKIDNMCAELGLRSICIWSTNNSEYSLNSYQKKVREYIINNEKLPDDIQVLIFNKSMETGVNIKDDNVDLCIVNSTNITEQIQARGRFRKDLNLVVIKTNSDTLPPMKITIDDKYLNTWIPKDELDEYIKSLQLKDSNNRSIGIRAFNRILRYSNYKCDTRTKRTNNGKKTQYYIHN